MSFATMPGQVMSTSAPLCSRAGYTSTSRVKVRLSMKPCPKTCSSVSLSNHMFKPRNSDNRDNVKALANSRSFSGAFSRWADTGTEHASALSSTVKPSMNTNLKVVVLASMAMLFCSTLRLNFPAIAPLVATELNLSIMALGHIHTAFLVGYFAGHYPAGILADKFGGARVLYCGFAMWSLVTALHVILPTARTYETLLLLRFLVGVSSAVAVPSLAAMLAQLLAPADRPKAMSTAYGFFSLGSVLGLGITPLLLSAMPWPAAFCAMGCAGTAAALVGLLHLLPQLADRSKETSSLPSSTSPAAVAPAPKSQAPDASGSAWHTAKQLFALTWAHSVIGWGFFIFQNWIPTYLKSLGMQDQVTLGLLSALPWALTTLLSFVVGNIFTYLEARGMSSYRARSLAHAAACIGSGCALIPIGLGLTANATQSLICINASLAMQACNYPGFHSYVQQFGANKAGTILGLTNSFGILAGILANFAIGVIVPLTGSYQTVFAATSVIYMSSWIVWSVLLKGEPVYTTVAVQAA